MKTRMIPHTGNSIPMLPASKSNANNKKIARIFSGEISLQRKAGSLICLLLLFLTHAGKSQCPSAPTVTSPVNYCMNTTAVALTATGTNLSWGGATGTVGGTTALTSAVYIDGTVSNNKKTNFTTTQINVTINTIDYYIPAYQSVSGLVLCLYNNSGTVIATSSTTTTQTAGASAVKITNTFNYVIAAAGNYSVGVSSGSGNIGKDNPSFPITEASGTVNITGVSSSGNRCFNNIAFTNGSASAPTPSTAAAGSTNYYVTQTANGCTSSPATITVIVSATGGSAPTVTSPVNLCMNTTASALTATGSNLSWGGSTGTVGGTSTLTSVVYIDNSVSNNRKTNFTTTANATINTIDYYIPASQAVSGLVLSIYNNSGTVIATSSTTTTQTAGGSAVKITNTFNYTIANAGNYSVGVSAGSGNIGYDNPAFPLTESSGTINITGVSSSGNRCFNNITFTMNANPTAPTPLTTSAGSTNYYVTQTVSGCVSPSATINVVVAATGGSAPAVTSPVNYCQNATASQLTATGSNLLWIGAATPGSDGGTSTLTSAVYLDNTASNNKKTIFTTNRANITVNTIDYYIPAYQAVSGMVLSIFNNAGTIIATSATTTTQTAGASAVKITNTFNYTIASAGTYSVGVSAGSGNIGSDNPSFPITEASGSITTTGVSSTGNRCFNNIAFTINTNTTAPTPVTTTVGSTSYTVTQTVSGCLSPAATIVVNVGTASSASISYGGSPYCKSLSSAQVVTQTGTSGGTYSSTTGLTINSSTGAITPSTSTAGTYIVTYTFGSTCISTTTASVTITAIPSATISYASNPYCSNAGTATVTRTGTTGGSYSSTTGLSINSSSGDINLAASTLGTYTVTYTIAPGGGCTQYQTTTSVTIGTAGTWTGASNTDWANAGNWFCGQVPGSSTNVVIPGSLSNYPVITTTQAINNISIQSGASVTISAGKLQIGGTVSNSGIFNTSAGTIEMTGSVAQTIPANVFQNNSVNNLVISNTSVSGVSLGGALDVYGSITYSGTGMTLNTNDVLTLKSNASATASLGDMTGNTINGKVTVEKYIAAKKAWRLLSVPTNTTQTINQSWQEAATNTSSNPTPGYGIQITGGTSANWAANGFDIYSTAPSMKAYNPSTNSWVGISNTNSSNIKATDGYMVFIRGDRTVNTYNAAATATVLRTKGSLYTGDQATINIAANKFGVIGNPYPSVLDMRNIAKTGFKNFFYVWDPKLGGSSGYGGYQTFSYSGGNYVVTPGSGSYGASGSIYNYIESGQAFFLQSTGSGGSVSMRESAKSPSFSRSASDSSIDLTPKLHVNLYGVNADSSTYMSDGLLINYDDSYSNDVDDMDAVKSTNFSENLSVKTDNTFLVIERRHTIVDKDTIFLNLANTKVQQYRFEITAEQLGTQGLIAFLEDSYLQTSTPLDLTGTTLVNFNIANIPGSYAQDRFRITFELMAPLPVNFTSINAYRNNDKVNIQWNVENELNIRQYEVERSGNAAQFNSIMVLAAKANGDHKANYLATDTKPLEGYNYYRIKSISQDGKNSYTGIVKVMMQKAKENITLNSNIITDAGLQLLFNNMPSGKYNVQLFNIAGQKIFTTSIEYPGGTSTEIITIDKKLLPGIYQLEIITPEGKTISEKMIK